MINAARERALTSLEGLSVGDAFGECFFHLPEVWIRDRHLPEPPWRWTDDTHMALSIVEVVLDHGKVDPDLLSQRFAERFFEEPWRGYAGGAARLLTRLHRGADWREEAPKLFGEGSYGNGGAMRVAPLGAYFAGKPDLAAEQAQISARITHAHPEGQAGALAVAVGSSILASSAPTSGREFIQQVESYLPPSRTRDTVNRAIEIEPTALPDAIQRLGTGQQVAAFDTVPFCIWIAAHYGTEWEQAMWTTVRGLGDRDTTCAIVGGMIAVRTSIPQEWLRRRESLPEGFNLTR